MVSPRSVRLSADVLRRLDSAARRRGTSVSSTIERLVDEGLRREAHPEITFRDGPSGRRASLVGGPDVDEVVRTLHLVRSDGVADVVRGVADITSLTARQVRAAVAYYADHSAEVDARIAANEEAAEELEAAWRRQQEILAGPTS